MLDWLEIVLVFLLLLIVYFELIRPRNFPPGPLALPLLGNIPALLLAQGNTPHARLWSLARRHGPVMGIFMRWRANVHVSGYRAVRHVLEREDLGYRPLVNSPHARSAKRGPGLFLANGPGWQANRSLVEEQLRMLPGGRSETLISDQARHLLEAVEAELELHSDGSTDLLAILQVFATDLLWRLIAGERSTELAELRFRRMVATIQKFLSFERKNSPGSLYPVLEKFNFSTLPFSDHKKLAKELRQYVQFAVEEHVANYDEDNIVDLIDHFNQRIHQVADPDPTHTRSELVTSCMDLLVAGTEPLVNLLAYSVRYLVLRQDVQTRLRQEIRHVLGFERLPTLADVNRLPYTQAVLHETLRHSGLIPFTAPHAPSTPTTLMGHRIPKGCTILVNLWSVHMDPDIWGDPENFRPDRFMAEDGTFRQDEHLLTFGLGPRMCPSSSLAMHTSLVFLASLVQRFRLEPPLQGPAPSERQLPGVTTSPEYYHVSLARAGPRTPRTPQLEVNGPVFPRAPCETSIPDTQHTCDSAKRDTPHHQPACPVLHKSTVGTGDSSTSVRLETSLPSSPDKVQARPPLDKTPAQPPLTTACIKPQMNGLSDTIHGLDVAAERDAKPTRNGEIKSPAKISSEKISSPRLNQLAELGETLSLIRPADK